MSKAVPHLILGVTRQNDDPKGPVTGLIYREGDKLRWGAIAVLFGSDAPPKFFKLIARPDGVAHQGLERVEYTVNMAPRFLFRQTDGKLVQDELKDKLQFSEAKKALLKPQQLAKPLQLSTLTAEYLEVSRLSDLMRQEMMGGERSVGQLAELLGMPAADKVLNETLWELGRRGWVTVHDLGNPKENAIALNKPLPAMKA